MLTLALMFLQLSAAASTASSATVQNQPPVPQQTSQPGQTNPLQNSPGNAPVVATPLDSEGPRASGGPLGTVAPTAKPNARPTARSFPTPVPMKTVTPIP